MDGNVDGSVPSRFLRTFRQPIGPPPVRLPIKQRHVQVTPRAPLALRDALGPRGDEHEGRPAVGEGARRARSPADLAVQPLDGVVGADAGPVLPREPGVS